MGPLVVVVTDPDIQIRLQVFDCCVDFLSERHLIEFLQNRLVEPFANTVSLRSTGLRSGVLDFVDCEEQLEIMALRLAAVFRASVSEDA